MKKYTQEEFDNFPVIDGIKQCPTGDYSLISSFAEGCTFAGGCSFAERCSFAEWCSFAGGCSFAEWCSFAEGCSFAERCSFAEGCTFAGGCSFAERCSFAEWCTFAERCRFEIDTEAKEGYPFIAFVGAGSRPGSKVYFFNLVTGIYVRCGCWAGYIDNFIQRIKDENADPLYLQLSDIAKTKFQ